MLAEHHRQQLLDSAVSLDLAEEHGVESYEGGIVFPYRRPQGQVVLVRKPDDPPLNDDGRPIKYLSPKGQTPGLNVVLNAGGGAPLLLIEGTKQALAVASWAPPSFAVAGMNGCWGWRHRPAGPDGPSVIIPDLDMVEGRDVIVAFDADYHTNDDVHAAGEGLARACYARGATSVRRLEHEGQGTEGLDDVLAGIDETMRTWQLETWIENAVDVPRVEEKPNPLGPFLYDSNDLAAIPPPEPLIEGGVLDKATVTVLAGKFGTYKTFVALSWAGCLATGTPWADHEVVEPRPVLYVAAEGVGGFAARVRAWRNGFLEGRPIDHGMLTVYARPINLLDREQVEALRDHTVEMGYGLVVIDTLHRCAPGVDEDSSSGIGGVPMASLYGLRDDTRVSVLALHHTGHRGLRARGSSAIEDDADASWVIKLAGDGEDRGPHVGRTLVHRKAKDGELHREVNLQLKLDDDTGSAYVSPGSGALDPEVARIVSWLSAHDIPLKAGRDSVWDERDSSGFTGSKRNLEKALAFRKKRAELLGQGG